MKLGLVCISELLREKNKNFGFKTMTRQQYHRFATSELAVDAISIRIIQNLIASHETIKHCSSIGIKHYRLSSSLFPLITDPLLNLDIQTFPKYNDILVKMAAIGVAAKQYGVSLSLHPDQFVVLGSNSDEVCEKSIKELNFYGWMLDNMGCEKDYTCPINIHPAVSTFAVSAEATVDKFVNSFMKCDASVRARLVVENEDRGFWTCSNLYDYFHNYVKEKYGFHFPLTLDNWHDHCNPSVDSNNVKIPYNTFFLKFYNTWPNVPVFHWSEGISDDSRAHTTILTLDPPDLGLDVIYEIEVKGKDKGFQHLLPKGQSISV